MDVTYTPEWKKYEEGMHSDNVEEAREATEKFTSVREHEMNTDSKAKRWEESRKKSWQDAKPDWREEQIKKANSPTEEFRKELKQAGTFDTGLKPTPGYLIVDLGAKEEVTESGIYIPTAVVDDAYKNTGIVLDVGDEVVIESPYKVPQPCHKGNKILFKKGAGVELEINNHTCRFMSFSDVLATFYA